MPFARYVPEWTGFPGSPGYTVLHFSGQPSGASVAALAEDVRDFFQAIAGLLPTNITITYPGEMTIHLDDGTLFGVEAVSPVPAITDATGLGSYAAPTGMRVNWETGNIAGGRRIRGRSFIVPTIVATYDTSGSLLATHQTTLRDAANALVTATTAVGHPICVWSPTTTSVSDVESANVPDQATVLRSRRD